jgi:hypothetical protein
MGEAVACGEVETMSAGTKDPREPDEGAGNNRSTRKADAASGTHRINTPKNATPGQIWTLIDLAEEFSSKQVTLKFYETPTNFVLDLRTDTAARARFIEYLLTRVRKGQELVERLAKLPSPPSEVLHHEELVRESGCPVVCDGGDDPSAG